MRENYKDDTLGDTKGEFSDSYELPLYMIFEALHGNSHYRNSAYVGMFWTYGQRSILP